MTEQLTFETSPRLLWCDQHPDAWAYMCRVAQELVDAELPFGMRFLIELARYEFRVRRREKDPYALNNNLQRALGEKLRAEVPGAERLMRTR